MFRTYSFPLQDSGSNPLRATTKHQIDCIKSESSKTHKNYPEHSHKNFGYNDVFTDSDIIFQKQRDAENKSNIQSLIDYNKRTEKYKKMDDLIKSADPSPRKSTMKKQP